MKKVTKRAKAWIIVLICVVAAVVVAVPIVRARFYYGDEPVFMGNPTMQQLIYHGSDIVMLPEKRENIHATLAYATYNGNTYVGDQRMDWYFDEDKMQYAGQIHRRLILHLYQNYDVYVSANVVTEDGTPIFLSCGGGDTPPFYYVLEGYEAPDIMTSELKIELKDRGGDKWSLPDTVTLGDIVDLQGRVPYSDDMQVICSMTVISAEYDFMCDWFSVCLWGEQYYFYYGPDELYPITSERLIECLSHIEKQQTV